MAQQSSISGVKVLVLGLGFGFFLYILAPPMYWYFVGGEPDRVSASCPSCSYDCTDEVHTALTAFHNISIPDCAKNDPDMIEELGKSKYQKLLEEMKLQEKLADETEKQSKASLLEAKKVASQFQKDFERCSSGMETTEGAREKAEAALAQEKKLSLLWEARAKELGWKEENVDSSDDKHAENKGSDDDKKPRAESKYPHSRKNRKEITDLGATLAGGRYVVQRAVDNEMASLKAAREQAAEMTLL